MKKLCFVLLVLLSTVTLAYSMGKFTKPEVVVEPTPVKALPLMGYVWEDSDSVANKSYIGLPVGMQAKSVKVNATMFVYRQTWSSGSELWYGPTVSNFNKTAEIVVIDKRNIKYTSKATVPNNPIPIGNIEKLSYHGRGNGDRPTWYGKRRLENYARTITVEIKGCVKRTITHNGKRYDRNNLIVKQSDVAGRGLAVVYHTSCKSKTAYVTE